jgi:hypothetical protein
MDQPKIAKSKALRLPKNTIGTVNPRPSSNDYEADFYGNNSRDGVDFPALVRFIEKVSTNPKCIFNWKDFERQPTIRSYSTRDGEGGTIQRMELINNNIPFTYKNESGKTINTFFQAKLNKRIDYVDYNWGYDIQIDAKEKIIYAKLSLYYVDTEKFRSEVSSTPNPNDFTVNDKYRAIIFQTDNLTDFAFFVNSIDPSQFNFIKGKIKTKMGDAIKKAEDEEEIVFLFENAPSWIAESFKNEELINYLKLILNYDIDGYFSGYIDGSSAFINVLRGFNTQDKLTYLYNFFNENPEFVKETYRALDGTSVWEGIEMPNKSIFASFLVSLCYSNFDILKFSSKTFFIGNGYKVNTSAIGALDFNEKEYFLKQEITELAGFITLPNSTPYFITYDKDLEDGSYYSPLEIVHLYDVAQKTSIIVPAIFLHDRASREELSEILKVVRIGVNIFVIAVSIASLGSASPLVALVAGVDLVLASTDTIIALAEDELSKEFVDTWSKIYLVGGAVTAAPLLLNKVFTIGVKVLNGAAKAEFKNFIRAFVFKVVLEKNIANFTKSTIKEILFIEESIIADGIRIELAEITRLQKAGATFIKGLGFDGKVKGYAVIYKGEEIAGGSAKEIRETLKEAWKTSGAKLVEVLDDLWKLKPKITPDLNHWTAFNLANTELRWSRVFEKDINKSIEIALKSSNEGKLWEAEVARELGKYDKITDFGNIYDIIKNGKKFNNAGDIDVGSSKYIIECKESVSKNIDSEKFLKQFDKYFNPRNEKYINLNNRKCILAIKSFKDNAIDITHPVFKALQRKGVIIITDLQQIKNLR